MMKFINFKLLPICALALLLASCGGGDKITSSIGGSVTGPGLSGTALVLQDNGADNLTVTTNSFTFATQLEAGSEYNVTVLTQPEGQTCFVENGIGVVQASIGNVSSITVVCNESTSPSNDVLVQVNNLNANSRLTLTNNGTDSLVVSNSAGNAHINSYFPTPLVLNTTYDVAVVTLQPSTQTCTVTNASASGTITLNGMVTTSTINLNQTPPYLGTPQGPVIVNCQ